MPECHRCPYNKAKDEACIACPGVSAFGFRMRRAVRFHDNPEAERVGALIVSRRAEETPEEVDSQESARLLLACLTQLQDSDLLFLMDRLRGLSYSKTAQRHDVAETTVWKHLKKASARLPWLERFLQTKPCTHHLRKGKSYDLYA